MASLQGANCKEIQVAFKIQDVYERSPLAHDLAVHLELFLIVALHHQHDVLAHHEVRILVLIGVVTHTGHAIREVAEHAALGLVAELQSDRLTGLDAGSLRRIIQNLGIVLGTGFLDN